MKRTMGMIIIFFMLVWLCGCSLGGRMHSIPKELSLVKETEHALFYVRDTDEDYRDMIEILSAAFEEHYDRITEMLKFEPPEKTVVWIYTDKKQYQEMIGRDTEGTYDAADRRIKVYTPSDLSQTHVRKAFTDQLIHEFVHAVIQQKNPIIGHVKWLDEGTAYYVSMQLQDELRSGKRIGDPFPDLEKFEESELYFEEAGGEAYYFSGLIVQFIYETYGEEAFHEILEDPEALESILGVSIPELYEEWKAYVLELYKDLI